MRRGAMAILVAALASLVAIAPYAATSASAASCSKSQIFSDGSWTTIKGPAFGSMTDLSVDPAQPSHMFVTNGKEIARTVDGGCTFKSVYKLTDQPSAQQPFPGTAASITSIHVPEATGHEHVYATIIEAAGNQLRPHVVFSADEGDTWGTGDAGLPLTGYPTQLMAAPANPSTLLLAIGHNVPATTDAPGSIDLFFASTDSGQTWVARSNPAGTPTNALLHGFTIDPQFPSLVWTWGAGGLYHSVDGAATFTAIKDFAGSASGPGDVFHKGDKARVIAYKADLPGFLRSDKGGAGGWLRVGSPAAATSIAHGPTPDDMVITALGSAYGFYPPTGNWNDLGAPVAGLEDIQADRTSSTRYYARTAHTIEIYSGQPDEIPADAPPPAGIFNVPAIASPQLPEKTPPALGPDKNKIVLRTGQSKTVTYKLTVPERPLPLDVFFLLDTSSSQTGTIAGLVKATAEIADGLSRAGIAVQFGLGDFRVYPDTFPPRDPEPNYPYKRDLDIGADPLALQSALAHLRAEAGGQYKAQLGALYQMATGAGQDLYPYGTSLGHDIPPGQQADYRQKALHVVIMASDEYFGTNDNGSGSSGGLPNPTDRRPNIPTFDEVIAALNDKDIKQVGLSIGSEPRPDLNRVAAGTHTLAPAGGVDCNGDGITDLAAGDPLVCQLARSKLEEGTNLVPAITNLLNAIPDSTPVDLSVSGGKPVVRSVTPSHYNNVVLQTAKQLKFDVSYRCPLAAAGKKFPIDLRATTNAGLLAKAQTFVQCRDIPKKLPPPLIVPILEAFAPLVIPPPPPPPPPVSTISQAQAQSQAQVQGGAAFQEEKQPQAAFVNAYDQFMQNQAEAALADDDYAMTSYHKPGEISPVLTVGAGVVLLSFMYGFVTFSKERIRVERVKR